MIKHGIAMIAIVDDDDSVRRSLRNLFVSLGFGIETFASAEAFALFAHRDEVECLILDLKMSGMSGLDLLEAQAAGHRVPTIILTGRGSDEMRRRCLQAGALAFMHKPFNTAELIKMVGTVISPAQSRVDTAPAPLYLSG
jgi:FixJ family two-component response regulator